MVLIKSMEEGGITVVLALLLTVSDFEHPCYRETGTVQFNAVQIEIQ